MPNLGLDTVGANTFGPIANEKRGYKHTLPAGDWRFTGAKIYDGASASWKETTFGAPVNAAAGGNVPYYIGFIYNGTSSFRLLIYTDSGGNADARLVQSDELTIATPSLRYNDPGSGSNQWVIGDTYADGASDPWGAPTVSPQIVSVYAVYEAISTTAVGAFQ